jgi:hypothetical protein
LSSNLNNGAIFKQLNNKKMIQKIKLGNGKKVETYVNKLSKANWKTLVRFGVVGNIGGNGFSNTTKEFDNEFTVSSRYVAIIKVKNKLYGVSYIDGCFYPVWCLVDSNVEVEERYINTIKTPLNKTK